MAPLFLQKMLKISSCITEQCSKPRFVGLYKGLYYPVIKGLISHYKDPYQPTRIQWNVNRVLNFAQLACYPGWKGLAELSENWWMEKRPEEALRVAAFLRFLQELLAKKNVCEKNKTRVSFPLLI